VVFDLMEAVMQGRAADALAATDRAHSRGADLGALLGDMLELTHTISRLKTVPELRTSQELPEAERTRGAALADKLGIPSLGRAWQMLLKGMAEVEHAPDRRAAAEMVLIRLCHVAELPPPGDLVRRLQTNPPSLAASPPQTAPNGGGSGARLAVGGGGAMAIAEPAPAAAPRLASFRDVLALASAEGELLLHGHLLHSIHLVKFAPPIIELRPQPDAPRKLAGDLANLLQKATGTRWTIVVSAEEGAATLANQGNTADAARRQAAAEHPLVRAIMAAFPGARIDSVREHGVDAYGLPAEDPAELMPLGEPASDPEGPELIPYDSDPAEGPPAGYGDMMEMNR